MKQDVFKKEGSKDVHLIDVTGNHFVNEKCINPKEWEGHIGDTHPPEDLRVRRKLQITGHLPIVRRESKGGFVLHHVKRGFEHLIK